MTTFSSRLFAWLLLCVLASATTMPLTTVTDTVYRADGTPAQGTVMISWPAFTTSDNRAVAAGSKSVAIGANGTLTVALAPNLGGTPSGTYYKVVYKLSDGSTTQEYWSVPSVPLTTISAIRSKLVPSTVALQVVSRQYVDSALSAKADNSAVIHASGDEPVAGVKTFASSPSVPSPTNDTDATNKLYVDGVVTARGVTSFNGRTGSVMPQPSDYISGTITKGKCLHTDATSGAITETSADCGIGGAGSAPDASASTKGIVQLAGDLAGTAAAPTVAKLGGMLTASNFPGATDDAKLSSAIASLPSAGGVVYLDTAQTWAACPTFGSNWVHIVALKKPTMPNADCATPPMWCFRSIRARPRTPPPAGS